MQKNKQIKIKTSYLSKLIPVAFIVFMVTINLAYAQYGLISCGGVDCTFADIFKTVTNIINQVLKIGIAFIAVTIAYAGFLYMTAQGNSSKVEQAHEMFRKALFGFIITISAYAAIYLIVEYFGLTTNIINLTK